MFQVVVSIVCAVMGVAIGALVAKVKLFRQVETEKANARKDCETMQGNIANLQASLRVAENTAAELKQRLASDALACEKRIAEVKSEADKRLAEVKAEAEKRQETEKAEAAKRFAEAKLAAEQRLAEFKSAAARQCEDADKRLAAAKAEFSRNITEAKAEYDRRIAEVKTDAEKQQKEAAAQRDADFSKQLATMKAQFASLSEELLKKRTEDFKGTNKEEMSKITQPLLQQIDEMRKALEKNKEGNDKNISALNTTIENMMKQSNKLAEDAQNLTNALKNRGKVQGDWGEQVLCNILCDSGLRENEEFFTQKNYKTADGKDVRTDVVVKSSNGSAIVIDSKVSLTAYSDYLAAQDDTAREKSAKANLESVWSHVEELVKVDYARTVPNAVPYVLMFVPNEGSYILAMNTDPQIGLKAFKKGIIIINPTNLMLALSLILLTWQNTRQEETCQKIIDTATNLYEKFCGFSDNFARLGTQLQTARRTYDDALGQLNSGNGNIISRFEGMKKLGLVTTKKISEKLLMQ